MPSFKCAHRPTDYLHLDEGVIEEQGLDFFIQVYEDGNRAAVFLSREDAVKLAREILRMAGDNKA